MAHESQLAQSAGTAQRATSRGGWGRRLFDRLRRYRARDDAAQQLYFALVHQARQPVFYTEWGVPDSRDGRLELVSLHAILLMRRLRDEGGAGQDLAQSLFDLMFQDLDRHLREWGVGDLSVGKQVKKLAQSFLGKAAALDPLLAVADLGGLQSVLRRNVYTEVLGPEPMAVGRLAAYLLSQTHWLAAQDAAELLAGRVLFAPASDA